MPEFGFDLEDVARLIRLVDERGLERLILTDGERSVEIEGGSEGFPFFALSMQPGERSHRDRQAENRIAIESPMVGVFYRAAAPDAPPLVEVGDHIEEGQAIGMIEAMKVFSEIPSELAGTVVEIAAKNGDLVQQGQPLLYLKPEG